VQVFLTATKQVNTLVHLYGAPSVNIYQMCLLPYTYSNSQPLSIRLNKDELIRFWGQKVNGQGQTRPNMVKSHLFKNAPFHRMNTTWWLSIEDHLVL